VFAQLATWSTVLLGKVTAVQLNFRTVPVTGHINYIKKNLYWENDSSARVRYSPPFMKQEGLLKYVVVHVDGVRMWLWTTANNRPIVHPLGDIWGAMVEWYWQGKTKELGEILITVTLLPPQIQHGLTRAQSRASAVRCRRLTAWAIARP
jgi:hypothetical protein